MPVAKKNSTTKRTASTKTAVKKATSSTTTKKNVTTKPKTSAKTITKSTSAKKITVSKEPVEKNEEKPIYNDLPICLKDLPKNLEKFAKDYQLDISGTKSGIVFEQYMCEIFKVLKFRDVMHRGMPGDKGVDATFKMTKTREVDDLLYTYTERKTVKVAVQLKYRTKGVVNVDAIDQARRGMNSSNSDKAYCIITTRFKDDALEEAKRYKITAIDGEKLYKDYISKARQKGFKY